MFDNLKIGKKLLVLSGTVLALLLATLLWGINGLSSTVSNGQQVAGGNALRGELLQREVDHLNWMKKVSAFVSDPAINELSVQLDHTQCGFGKWFYGKGRQDAEVLLPALQATLQQIEEPHLKLHASAAKIKEIYRKADPQLPQFLTEKELDHMNWVYKVQNAILSGENQLKVEFDHTQCGFGIFLYGEIGHEAAAQSPDLAAALEEIKAPHEQLHQQGLRIDELLSSGEQFRAADLFSEKTIPILNQVRSLLKQSQQLAHNSLQGQLQASQILASDTQENLQQVQELLRAMTESAANNILTDSEMIAAAIKARTGIIALGIIALLLGSGLSILISRSLTVPMQKTVAMIEELENGHLNNRLQMERADEIGQMATSMDRFADSLQNEIVHSLEKLANGDLTFEIAPRDEKDIVRGSLKKLGEDLNQIMAQILTAGDQIASGSLQVSDSAQSLSQGATESAASLEEISSSMNQIGAQTGQSAENASQANRLAGEAAEAAATGSEQMADMITAMGEINAAGQDISKIIKVIDEIAFQTNLLALNAAVEAARAGQHGKGFAVVAEEVRNLAARSAKAASETAELIEGSVEKATNGTRVAEKTADALEGVVTGITRVSDLVSGIATASNEQAQGISQVNQGLSQIDQVIQQNTASAEESAATSEELSGQAVELKNQLSHFRLNGNGPEGVPQPMSRALLSPTMPGNSGWSAMTQGAVQNGSDFVIHWDERLNTGISSMDKQHQRLVDLINQLFQYMKDGGDRMMLGSVVDELVKYTIYHFRAEEDLMKKHRYRDFDAHKKIHDEFAATVTEFAQNLKSGARLAPADIYKFLKDWLISHIEKQDRDGYGPYINKRI